MQTVASHAHSKPCTQEMTILLRDPCLLPSISAATGEVMATFSLFDLLAFCCSAMTGEVIATFSLLLLLAETLSPKMKPATYTEL